MTTMRKRRTATRNPMKRSPRSSENPTNSRIPRAAHLLPRSALDVAAARREVYDRRSAAIDCATLRNQRLGISAEADPAPLGDLVTLEQYLCVRPLPEPPPAGTQMAEGVRHAPANGKPSQAPRHDANSHGAPQKPAGVREQRAQPIRAESKAP